ncbi:MAG: gluconate 2-dehydrogenase subunit 3 family protein [Vicinamibacterales bacterium]
MAENNKGVSRRDLLKRAGLAGAALTIPIPAVPGVPEVPAVPEVAAQVPPRREPIENLTAYEADMLEAICARIIPTDANGPGAREARAAHYIDRALGGALSGSKAAYTAGLAAFDAYCRSSRRAPFTELSARDQDSVLIDVETGAATGFVGSAAAFFAMVRSHTLQGTFGDPYYGGNFNFIGWDLIGYPGVRTNVSAEDQRLGVKLTPNHQSAYDHQMFNKAQARRKEPSVPSVALGKSVADGY